MFKKIKRNKQIEQTLIQNINPSQIHAILLLLTQTIVDKTELSKVPLTILSHTGQRQTTKTKDFNHLK